MRFVLAIWLILVSGTALGHEVRPALFRLVQTAPGQYQATFKQPQIQGRFLGLRASTNCRDADQPIVSLDTSALEQRWNIGCDGEALRDIEIQGLRRTMIDTLVTIVYSDGTVVNHLISPNEPRFDVVKKAPWLPVYLVMGIEHLLFGFDHLLFVIVLMFVVRGVGNLIKSVTSFTVAHSITLGLSAFNVISVSQAPVEATIALSIVVLALQAFAPDRGNPWPIAFMFGLLHGLGFAGALREIGLPDDAAVWALAFFNIGIELGQLAIIAIVLAALFPVRRFRLPQWLRTAPLFFAGSVASYWLIQRSAQIILSS